MATFVELSLADWVVAVTPLLNTPELEVKPPNKVFLVAISTPSTVPDTVMFPVTDAPLLLINNLSLFPVEIANELSAGLYIAAAVEGVDIEPLKSI